MRTVPYKGQMVEVDDPPEVGTDIYVNSAWYLSHGVDDFEGGRCKVKHVRLDTSAGAPTWFVEVEERPGHSYNWTILKDQQDALRTRFGDRRGYRDPDLDPTANQWD